MISALLMLMSTPLNEMKSSMEPVSMDQGISMFSKLCFEKFPDSKAVLDAIGDPALGLTKLPKTPSEAMQPGDSWSSSTARVTYVDADWLPSDFGSPQCSATVLLSGKPSHSSIAKAMTTKLALPTVKFGKDGARAQTKWDKAGLALATWRIFLTTEQTPSGIQMRVINTNMRGK